MHICVSKQIIIGSDHGLLPGRRQAIIWTSSEILLIRPLGTNFSEIVIEIYTFSFEKMQLKFSSEKCGPLCLGLNIFMIINDIYIYDPYETSIMSFCTIMLRDSNIANR